MPPWQLLFRDTWLRRACVTVSAGVLVSCESPNVGVDPPEDQIFFPSGMIMDPRIAQPDPTTGASKAGVPAAPAVGAARWLFLTNANRDVAYNTGSVVAIDLEAFWDAWYDPATGRAYPYCDPEDRKPRRCVQPAGARLDADYPCRHVAVEPQVIECDESNFVDATVRIGNFTTDLAVSSEVDGDGDSYWRLWTPVRGDPSVTYIDLHISGDGDSVDFDCGQGQDSGQRDPLMCARDHRLTHVFGDKDEDPLAREPFSLLVDDENRFAYVAHAAGNAFTIIDLGDASHPPEIVEQVPLFAAPSGQFSGGFGLAKRPCFAAGQGPMGSADAEPNVPSITKGCTRPLIYAGYRFSAGLVTFAVTDQADVRSASVTGVGGLSTAGFTGPVLGQMSFADPRGDELYVVQTTPGALLQMDTSLGPDGEPANIPAAPPIELCLQPTVFTVHDDGIERLAFVSCFRSAAIFVVDLDSFEVVGSVLGGTGPHDLLVDPERQVLYSANTLEATLSVIDLSRTRGTRFSEIARIGIQEAFGG